jgi:hypothetical protein
MSWRNFKDSRFKEKAYEKTNISTLNPNDNKDNNDKKGAFVTFVNNVIESETDNQVFPVGQPQGELDAARDEMARRIVKKIEEEHTKNGGVPYFSTPEIAEAKSRVCLVNQQVLAGRATNQDFQTACANWPKVAPSCVSQTDCPQVSSLSTSVHTEQTQDTDEERELVDWFRSAELPQAPFNLDCARRVLDPVKFYTSLHQEIEARPSSPRWRCGATQADLRVLSAMNRSDNSNGGAK